MSQGEMSSVAKKSLGKFYIAFFAIVLLAGLVYLVANQSLISSINNVEKTEMIRWEY